VKLLRETPSVQSKKPEIKFAIDHHFRHKILLKSLNENT